MRSHIVNHCRQRELPSVCVLYFGRETCKMPRRCAVYGCDSTPNPDEGISVHVIPFFGDNRPEAVTRRRRWVNFVKRTRAQWEPTKNSAVCSKHFKPDDFEQPLAQSLAFSETFLRTLRHDDFGKVAYPTIYPTPSSASSAPETSQSTERKRRRVSVFYLKWFVVIDIESFYTHTVTVYFYPQLRRNILSELQESSTSTASASVAVASEGEGDEPDGMLEEAETQDVGSTGTPDTTSVWQIHTVK